MRPRSPSALAVLSLACLATEARAARPPEKRSDATYVVTGTVVGVYTADDGEYRHHVVALKIEEAEKGPGLKRGEILYASCYQRKPDAPGINWDSGHDLVPEVGARVKAFVNRGDGRNEGVYPNWVDVLAGPRPKPKSSAVAAPRRSP
jgi:hypothetical protein